QKLDISAYPLVDVPHSHAAAAEAVQMAAHGEVEALMKGSLHTDELMGAVVQHDSGLRTERRISHVFAMADENYHKPFYITDAAMNIAPDLLTKKDIVQNAIDLIVGISDEPMTPKVAVLAAVEVVNPAMQSTIDAACLCKMAERGQITGAIIDGPLAFDNAISAEAAKVKGITSAVAGDADIFLVPDIESGNMLAKQLILLGGASAAGIVLGARLPIILTSRSDGVASRIGSCALAVLMANAMREGRLTFAKA
ncbi:MAG: bifunctional enoyl-CoA hydratase/phosphate acetyltransferase, partial [Pseudomonadota bacterium]|nr:bifunctional enoyl-CoA hydratase/phosphate acetyltransferase [Pseudomonadota bacterium]